MLFEHEGKVYELKRHDAGGGFKTDGAVGAFRAMQAAEAFVDLPAYTVTIQCREEPPTKFTLEELNPERQYRVRFQSTSARDITARSAAEAVQTVRDSFATGFGLLSVEELP